MCAVIVKREMLRHSDIMCSVSKNPNDLRACLKNKYEKLLSYFVTVKFLREPVDMVRCENKCRFFKHWLLKRVVVCALSVSGFFLSVLVKYTLMIICNFYIKPG